MCYSIFVQPSWQKDHLHPTLLWIMGNLRLPPVLSKCSSQLSQIWNTSYPFLDSFGFWTKNTVMVGCYVYAVADFLKYLTVRVTHSSPFILLFCFFSPQSPCPFRSLLSLCPCLSICPSSLLLLGSSYLCPRRTWFLTSPTPAHFPSQEASSWSLLRVVGVPVRAFKLHMALTRCHR